MIWSLSFPSPYCLSFDFVVAECSIENDWFTTLSRVDCMIDADTDMKSLREVQLDESWGVTVVSSKSSPLINIDDKRDHDLNGLHFDEYYVYELGR